MGLIIKASYVPTAQTGAGSGFSGGHVGAAAVASSHPTLLQHLGFGFGAGTGMAATPLSRSPATAKPHAISRSVPQFPHLLPESPTGIRSPVPPHRGRVCSRRSPRATVSVPPPQDPSSTKRGTELGRGAAGFDEIIPAGGITQGKTGD